MKKILAAMIVGLAGLAQICCGQGSVYLSNGGSAYIGGNNILYSTYSSGSGTPGYTCSSRQNNGSWDIAYSSTNFTFILWNCSNINYTATYSWNLIGTGSGGGGVTSVTGTSPIQSSGGLTPAISIIQATTSTNGYLSSTDWNTFNGKQGAGSYITALTGDCTSSGPGSVSITCTKSSGTAFGSAAFDNTGTSGANIPLLNSNPTASGTWIFSASNALTLSASTAHGILLGEGSSPLSQVAVCGNNFPVVGQAGADPKCSTISYPSSLTSGGLIYGSSATALASDTDFTITGHVLTGGPSASLNLSGTNALVLSAMTGTSCLEEVSGVVTPTGATCGSGSGGVTSVSGTTNQIDVATGTTTPVISLDPNIIYPGVFNGTTTGIFTGATSYSYLNELINGCNPQTEWLAGQGTGNFTSGSVNCVTGPASPTNLTWGSMDMVSTSHAGLPDTAAHYFQCRVLINSGICYGDDVVLTDNGTLTSGIVFRSETDLDPNGPTTAYLSGVGRDYEIYNTLHTGMFPFTGITFGTGEAGVYWQEGIGFKQGAFGPLSIGINVGSQGTATSLTNFSSPIYDRVYGSFWNGSAAVNDYWQTQLFVPTGASPNFTEWYISHSGTTYGYYTLQNNIDIAMVHSDNLTFDLIVGSSATGSTLMDTLPGATGTFTLFTSTPTNGNCAQWVVAAGIATLGQSSGACGSGAGTVSGQASGVVPLGTSSTVISSQSHLSDNGTTVTSTEPIAAPSVTTTGSTNGALNLTSSGTGATGPSSNTVQITVPNSVTAYTRTMAGAAPTVASYSVYSTSGVETWQTSVANTTITVGTTTINANSCSTVATATMTGVTTSMTFSITPSTDIHSVTGWSAAGTTLYFVTWPTSNTLNYYVCNNSSSNITPGSSTTWNVSAK